MRWVVAAGVVLTTACTTASSPLPPAWESVPQTAPVGNECAHFECAAKAQSAVHVAGNALRNGDKVLTPRFEAIDSFDVSAERKEVVFSARRKDSFDVGLVSVDGSEIHWVPEDRADEVNAQWAPRGNKVSFVVRAAGGDIVRTVHVPTATPLSVDFPRAQVDSLVWEPAGQRYAVVVESPDASQRLVSMTYAGAERKELVPPSSRLDVEVDLIGGALVLRPSALRYNERLPLVVWLDRRPFAWSDARAALMRNARVAIAIAPEQGSIFAAAAKIPWIDTRRTYLVDPGAAVETLRNMTTTVIHADAALPPHTIRKKRNEVWAPAAVVQSVAAAFIADDLKRIPPPNGRR